MSVVTGVEGPDDMRALGRRLAELLRPGDLVVLSGPLGAGKTTLAQGIGAGLGVAGPVVSPTFVIARVYRDGRVPLVHVDAYRLGSVAEVDDLDLDASLEESVTLVEWGSGLVEGLADDRLEVRIDRPSGEGGESRTVELAPFGERWAAVRSTMSEDTRRSSMPASSSGQPAVSTSLSVAAILAESAKRDPAKAAVVFAGQEATYAELWDSARRYAAVLRAKGIGRGDRVALLLPNTPHFPMAYYGALALGAVVVPVHALLRAEEIQFVLEDAEARVLICAGPLLAEGAKGAELAGVPCLSVLDAGDSDGPVDDGIDVLAARADPIESYAVCDPYDDAVILYTSGTTGKPKGAVLSHFNIVMNSIGASTSVMDLRADDVLLGVLPLFHSFGQTCVMNAGFLAGATVVLMPRFDGAQALELMVNHGVTVFEGVPTMYVGLLDAARGDERRPALRRACSGGASLPVAVIERFKDVFGVDIYEGYGLSETSPVATFNQEVFGRKPGTVGCAIWGVEVEIARAEVEERIELLPPGEIGEVVIRGHNIMKGYHGRPEATAAAIVDGWFRSGDLGTKDTDGFVSIVDRKKDMVIRGGYNVYPREVEEKLLRHPAVGQVAVIGLPHDSLGEEVCAVVVKSPEAADRPDEELAGEIVAWSRDQLGRHKYPRMVRFVDAFPLGPSGKVLKRELVAAYREG